MQVSIYLDDRLVRELDHKARLKKNTRSGLIQKILKTFLQRGIQKTSPWDKVFGMLRQDSRSAEHFIQTIRRSRVNRRWK